MRAFAFRWGCVPGRAAHGYYTSAPISIMQFADASSEPMNPGPLCTMPSRKKKGVQGKCSLPKDYWHPS